MPCRVLRFGLIRAAPTLTDLRSAADQPLEPPPGGRQVNEQREAAHRSDTDSGTRQGIGDVMESQADKGTRHHDPGRASQRRDEDLDGVRPPSSRRAEQQYRDCRGQREDGCGMTARVGEDALVGAVDQVFEKTVVQSVSNRDGRRGQHGSVEPTAEQASKHDSHAQHGRRQWRARKKEPLPEALMADEPGNHGRVEPAIKPVCTGLMREEHTEDGDQRCTAG